MPGIPLTASVTASSLILCVRGLGEEVGCYARRWSPPSVPEAHEWQWSNAMLALKWRPTTIPRLVVKRESALQHELTAHHQPGALAAVLLLRPADTAAITADAIGLVLEVAVLQESQLVVSGPATRTVPMASGLVGGVRQNKNESYAGSWPSSTSFPASLQAVMRKPVPTAPVETHPAVIHSSYSRFVVKVDWMKEGTRTDAIAARNA
eukprot:CAMPEP_0119357930 /NCGR_PEP_ID=MMETSP1334-20130426/6232_1 /TAXON_ID=127549 /ORGANISM="Calcidiscus leptoporus, Strain RCC1130" /LENGTH=207 /DNA_ID=CAMNT_0007372287 /DNA_START=235 /DNA_END=858 /DNA_ORIENTATION=+